MIFVALGTREFQFNRLLAAVDACVQSGKIEDEVFAQIGQSDYVPLHYQFKQFLSKEQFERYIKQCDLLITHGGVATIAAGLLLRKPVIVVPRMKEYGENVDNHQIQIAEMFSNKNYVVMCRDTERLAECITLAKYSKLSSYKSQRMLAMEVIREYLLELGNSKK